MKITNMLSKTGMAGLCLLLTLMGSNCTTDDGFVPDDNSQTVLLLERDKGIAGTKLADIDFPNKSFISFWEVTPGDVAVRYSRKLEKETDSNDPIAARLDELMAKNTPIVDIYKELNPKYTPKQLIPLQEAQEREVRRNNETVKNSAESSTTRPRGTSNKNSSSEARVNCQGDLYGDNYSLQWFLDWAQYSQGNYVNKRHRANVTSNFYPSEVMTKVKTCAFAAGYDSGLEWSVSTEQNGWNDYFSHYLGPRNAECWWASYRNSGGFGTDVEFSEPCPRAHVIWMWTH